LARARSEATAAEQAVRNGERVVAAA